MENSCRIMIVDDEFIMRQGIRFMMKWEDSGYEIVGEASNGKEALELLPALRPHIVLCDIAMPLMNGLDFIKVVHRENPDIKLIVLSGYDNFEYVRTALLGGAADYVLKPTLNPEELLKLLDKVSAQIPTLQLKRKTVTSLEALLEQFLTGDGAEPDGRLVHGLPYSCHRLFFLPIQYRDRRGLDLSNLLYEKTEAFLKELSGCTYIKFLLRQETLCVALNYEVKDEDRLTGALTDFADSLSLMSERMLAVLGNRYQKLGDLKKDFVTPGILEKEGFYYKGVHLYRLEREETVPPKTDRFDFRKFAGEVSAHQYSEAMGDLDAYICQAAAGQMPEFKLKNQAKNLLYNLIGETTENASKLEAVCRDAFECIEGAMYSEEFLEVFHEALEHIQVIFEQEQDEQNIYIGEILDYIRKHYMEDLSLLSVATAFNFSYSYLSAYFNQYVHEGFNEYLNKIRIQRACEYLEDSGYPIAQVGLAVGYSDHSYFCRVFKKLVGEPPSAYRKHRQRR